MKDLIVLLMHLMTTLAKLMGPGGARAVVADSLLGSLTTVGSISFPLRFD